MSDMITDITDEILARKAAGGEIEAYEEIVKRNQAAVQRWILWVDRRQDRVEDLAQETFIKAWRSIGTFRGDSKLRTWIMRIALRVCMDAKRKAGENMTVSFDSIPDYMMLPESSGDAAVIDRAQIMELRDCMDKLEPIARAVLVMRYMEGYNATEIGRILDKPAGTIRRMLSEARDALRKSLGAESGKAMKALDEK